MPIFVMWLDTTHVILTNPGKIQQPKLNVKLNEKK